ncbi:MAG: YgeY family selenium metabolism-linked hydrolase [Polyangia bacterium]|nr:YgeY family selenium metabolism-linked hydrolase [Polyangia bacterium]
MFDAIRKAAARELPACRDFLKDLIAIKSLSAGEKAVVERIRDEMLAVGFDEVKFDGFGNVLGRVGSGPRVIAIDAHVDTVDSGDLSLWGRDPWEPFEKDGILYGRGASDQKGGMAAMVYAGKLIKELGLAGEASVWMVGSVMEEDCDGLCWQYILREKVLDPEVVISTEPTNLQLYRGHRGRMEIEVETKGLSCHGSAPERGVNAVYKMAPIIGEIEGMGPRLRTDPFLGQGTVTISQIRSTSPSLCAVADSCTIHLDRRLTFGETEESAMAEIRALPAVKRAEAQVRVLEYSEAAWTGLVYPTRKYYPSWATPEEHPTVRSAIEAHQGLFGKPPTVGRWVFSTNGVATAGMFGVPTLGFGPGNEQHAHSPEDQIPVEHLEVAMAFYAAFPRSYLAR